MTVFVGDLCITTLILLLGASIGWFLSKRIHAKEIYQQSSAYVRQVESLANQLTTVSDALGKKRAETDLLRTHIENKTRENEHLEAMLKESIVKSKRTKPLEEEKVTIETKLRTTELLLAQERKQKLSIQGLYQDAVGEGKQLASKYEILKAELEKYRLKEFVAEQETIAKCDELAVNIKRLEEKQSELVEIRETKEIIESELRHLKAVVAKKTI